MKKKVLLLCGSLGVMALHAPFAVAQTWSIAPSTVIDPVYKASPAAAARGYDVHLTSIVTVNDPVISSINGYRMVGIPDGLGTLDNGDGTFTLFMNHELPGGDVPGQDGRMVLTTNATTGVITTNFVGRPTGITRAFGGKGAFVSQWVIKKDTLEAIQGSDLTIPEGLFLWEPTNSAYRPFDPTNDFNPSRFCSADLPKTTAFYDPATGKGTPTRFFMDGEEGGSGRAFAHTASGPDKGKSYELPHLGRFAWENSVACPTPQDLTLVMGCNDSGLGDSFVYVYVGQKGSTGSDLERAGLLGGQLYAVRVDVAGAHVPSEDITNVLGGVTAKITTGTFSLYGYGDGSAYTAAQLVGLSVTNATGFLRTEDGAWDPTHPNDFYFVTTGRAANRDISHPTRLWRMHFTDLSQPQMGGTIDMVAEGAFGTGQAASTTNPTMWDNICFLPTGELLLQEDPGGNARLSKIWLFDTATGELTDIATAEPRYFANGAARFLTNDEESSGIVDASEVIGPGWVLFVVQAHYGIPGELVEGGQLMAMHLERSPLHFASSDIDPFYVPIPEAAAAGGYHVTTYSLLTVSEPSLSQTAYKLVGIPDGLGAFNNGDGTFTLTVNHELIGGIAPAGQGVEAYTTNSVLTTNEITQVITTNSVVTTNLVGQAVGVVRSYGGKGSFVSQWTVNSTNLEFISGQDFTQTNGLYLYENGGYRLFDPLTDYHISRFCSADLPAVTAFYNPDNGKGTQNRILLNGEEDSRPVLDPFPGLGGRAFAHVITGPDANKSFELPWLGKFAWENSVACPVPQDQTIVMGLDDSTLENSQVYVYIGTKQATGSDIEKAGLTNGKLFAIRVMNGASYVPLENNTNVLGSSYRVTFANFVLRPLGDVSNLTEQQLDGLSVSNATSFFRVEDGAWDPTHPNDFYFVTTGRASGNDVTHATRLWRLCFADVMKPEAGGTIEMVVDGPAGTGAAASNTQPVMLDNIAVLADGTLVMQEDPGNNARLSKIWHFDPATSQLTPLAQANPSFFQTGGDQFLTRDEESTGVIDASDIIGPGWILFAVQAHAKNADEALVEHGQIMAMRLAPVPAYPSIRIAPQSQTVGISSSVTLSVSPAGTGPFTYQWLQNGVPIPGGNGQSLTLYNLQLNQVGNVFAVAVTGPDGTVTSAPATIKVNPADPRLSNPALFPGMVFQGTPGGLYRIEYTPTVTDPQWQTLTNLTLPTSPYLFIDLSTTAAAPARYYRLVVP